MKRLFLLPQSRTTPKPPTQPQSQPSGFTLTELLVTIIIGSLITSTLLWLIVNLLNTSQRESALSETQRDMQRTLDYIAADMKEAVYVYDGSCHPTQTTVCPSYYRAPSADDDTDTAFLPDFAAGTVNGTEIPVLAFWKTDPVDEDDLTDLNCGTISSALKSECESLKKRRHVYTLVVYTQDTTNTGTWSGNARINRYELTKYRDVTTLTRNTGYVDPADEGSGVFETWPYSGVTNLQGATTAGGSAVTVTDFVDIPTPTDLGIGDLSCPTVDPDTNASGNYYVDEGDPSSTGDTYLITPRRSGAVLSYTFYACVRNVEGEIGRNQDVAIYLRGNAAGRGSFAGTDGPLPVLQTQITMRGVIDK